MARTINSKVIEIFISAMAHEYGLENPHVIAAGKLGESYEKGEITIQSFWNQVNQLVLRAEKELTE